MSSFMCEHCGETIQDTPIGFVTSCSHHPLTKFRVGWPVIMGNQEYTIVSIEKREDPLDHDNAMNLVLEKRDESGELIEVLRGIHSDWIDRIVYTESPV